MLPHFLGVERARVEYWLPLRLQPDLPTMALVLILQLLTLWPLCHTGITSTGTQEARGPRTPVYSVPPPSHPTKPWLRAQPAAVVSPGINVTLTCWAPQPAWRFALFTSGETAPVLSQEVLFRHLVEFFLEEVTEAQAGSYRCRYSSPLWTRGVWSQPSDALELLVTAAAPVAGGAPRAGGGARRHREPALRGPRGQHELRAVPRGRGGAAAVPGGHAALGRLRAAPRARPGDLHLLLPHAGRALRAVGAQRAAGRQPRRLGPPGLHPRQPRPPRAGRPRPPLPGRAGPLGLAPLASRRCQRLPLRLEDWIPTPAAGTTSRRGREAAGWPGWARPFLLAGRAPQVLQ